MPRTERTFLLLLTAASLGLVSCATMRTAGADSVAAMKSTTSAALAKMSDLPGVRLLPGQSPKVVEVREEDLKPLPSGHELAKAHRNRRSGFWIFGGPVDFTEPSLPEPGSDPDGSLLPPRLP